MLYYSFTNEWIIENLTGVYENECLKELGALKYLLIIFFFKGIGTFDSKSKSMPDGERSFVYMLKAPTAFYQNQVISSYYLQFCTEQLLSLRSLAEIEQLIPASCTQ